MRISSYIIGAPLSGQPFYILMHGFTGAIDKVPYRLGKHLVEQKGMECDDANSVIAALPSHERAQLEERGYLTKLSHSEERQVMIQIAALLHELDIATSPTNFMFVPTYTCNLRCPYCFQSHEMHAGKGHFSTVITRERVDQVFAIIDRLTRRGAIAAELGLLDKSIELEPFNHARNIGLFGGEPLSSVSLPIIPYIVEQSTKRGYTLSAVTNGVELEAFAEMIGPGLIDELQITLDGLAQLHDTRRVGPGFRHTFDIIVKNISLALRRGARVSVRLNVDSTNIDNVQGLGEYFNQLGWSEHPNFSAHAATVFSVQEERRVASNAPSVTASISRQAKNATFIPLSSLKEEKLVSPHPKPYRKDLVSQAQLVDLTSTLKDTSRSCIQSYERWARDVLQRCLEGDGYPFKRVAHCSAESGLLMFDPVGDVYTCWEEVGQQEFRIATYDGQGIHFLAETATQWLSRFPGAIEQCSECPYALIHTSGCAKHARATSGTIFASACESFQQYFPLQFARAYQQLEKAVLSCKGKG